MGWRVPRPVSGFCGRLPFEGVRQRLSGRGFTLRGEDCGRSQSPEGRASVS
nr:MAG TPA: Spermatid-specific manchette-related protein 1 [Caudoviricetes sp.]